MHDLINHLYILAASKTVWFFQRSLVVVAVGGRYWQMLIVGVQRGSWEASPAPSVTERNLGRWIHSPHLMHIQMP